MNVVRVMGPGDSFKYAMLMRTQGKWAFVKYHEEGPEERVSRSSCEAHSRREAVDFEALIEAWALYLENGAASELPRESARIPQGIRDDVLILIISDSLSHQRRRAAVVLLDDQDSLQDIITGFDKDVHYEAPAEDGGSEVLEDDDDDEQDEILRKLAIKRLKELRRNN